MPVGTRGAVRLLDAADLDALSPQVVLANTYHLMLRPGADTVEALGGLHRFTGWEGHLLTDSGGFQVFSLAPHVDDDGVTFRSTYDGSIHRLSAESAVAIQEQLGADIAMVLDVCTALPASEQALKVAMERTLRWTERARDAHRRSDQTLFGIVQGGTSPDLRAECAERCVALGLDGYGIGGLSVGETLGEMLPALDAVTARLPADQPRYLMGVGDPVAILEAIALGVDMFDCVLPTRLARHGTALTSGGRLSIKSAAVSKNTGPIDERCGCRVCARVSRGYLRHLFSVGEPTAGRLLTIHNLTWLLALVDEAGKAIESGTFGDLRARTAAIWQAKTLR